MPPPSASRLSPVLRLPLRLPKMRLFHPSFETPPESAGSLCLLTQDLRKHSRPAGPPHRTVSTLVPLAVHRAPWRTAEPLQYPVSNITVPSLSSPCRHRCRSASERQIYAWSRIACFEPFPRYPAHAIALQVAVCGKSFRCNEVFATLRLRVRH